MRGVYAISLFFLLINCIRAKKIRWCTVSDPEQRKCAELAKALVAVLPPAAVAAFARLSCIRASTTDCIDRIRFGLGAIAKEIYSDGGCVLSVAVVRNISLDVRSLKGLRSCHSGVRWTAGWSLPLGFLLSRNYLSWSKEQPLSQDVSTFFSASCVPGAAAIAPLCALCAKARSHIFARRITTAKHPIMSPSTTTRGPSDSDRDEFRLLCADGSQAPLSHYRICNLGRGPGGGMVTRLNFRKTARKFLSTVQMLFGKRGKERQRFQLFNSSSFGENDLLFKDATDKLAVLPDGMDVSQMLGLDYVALLKGLGHEGSSLEDSVVRWCCISLAEQKKCEQWALNIKSDPLVCVRAVSMRDCIEKIKRDEVDAVSLDATHSFIAGKCGLVPVVTEYYGIDPLGDGRYHSTFYKLHEIIFISDVSVVFKTSPLSPLSVALSGCRGRGEALEQKCFHGEPGGPALLSRTHGNLCKVCLGGTGEAATKRCADNHNERYYGNTGALRCLVGDPSGKSYGDVAFLEQHTLLDNILSLNSSGWAEGWTLSDYELLCGDGRRAPLAEWESCNLGVIPPNSVMTRPVLTARVYDFLMKSQETLSANPNAEFKLFQSQEYGESDLLFKDATQCFVHTGHMDPRSILGEEFYSQAEAAFNCTHSDILEFCNQDMRLPRQILTLHAVRRASSVPAGMVSFVPACSKADANSLELLQDFVSRARRLFVITGAGLSTESGIPDYRSERWEERGKLHWLVTQNVDSLHSKAGQKRLTELHGCAHRVMCLGCGAVSEREELQARFIALNPEWRAQTSGVAPDGDVFIEDEQVLHFRVPSCEACGGILKPE
ncbi:hypothetical protein F7725_016992, partial [Dissostichus mawsoni]